MQVICIDQQEYKNITKGKTYEVLDCNKIENGTKVVYKIKDNSNKIETPYWYPSECFIKQGDYVILKDDFSVMKVMFDDECGLCIGPFHSTQKFVSENVISSAKTYEEINNKRQTLINEFKQVGVNDE